MAKGSDWFKKGYWGLVKGESFLGHFLLLAIRLYWGALLVMAGASKWVDIHTIGKHFEGYGIPNPQVMAYVVATIELLGGISFIFGILTRFFSLMLSVVFVVAFFTAHPD